MSRRAVILAGGTGTRLRPYTVVLPKPLMPIGEFPILEVIVRQLARCGFDRITMAVNHQAELIKAFFQDGGKWGLRIDYSLEDRPLGTMGPLRLIGDLPRDFLVMNGDILTDLDFGKLHDDHAASDSVFTISSSCREEIIDFGVLETDGAGRLSAHVVRIRARAAADAARIDPAAARTAGGAEEAHVGRVRAGTRAGGADRRATRTRSRRRSRGRAGRGRAGRGKAPFTAGVHSMNAWKWKPFPMPLTPRVPNWSVTSWEIEGPGGQDIR